MGFLLLALFHPLPQTPDPAGAVALVDVLVQGEGAAAAVAAAGGRAVAALPIVEGLVARVPAGAVDRLRRGRPGVRAVLDATSPLHVQGLAPTLPGPAAAARERFGIRVLSLSLGAPPGDPASAPLAEAVERLWADGVTVVTAAGNQGGTVTAPGLDPYAVTVGALDPAAGAAAPWSGSGPDAAGRPKPDLLAPRVGVVGLRAPGSTVDLANPDARVGERHFRGSGTSMSTALVAGAAAAVAAARPGWGPDEVKAARVAAARPPGPEGSGAAAGGQGALDLAGALRPAAVAPANRDLPALRAQGVPAAPGGLGWRAGAFQGLRWGLGDGAAPAAGVAAFLARPFAADRAADGRTWAARQWLARNWAARNWAARNWGGAGS